MSVVFKLKNVMDRPLAFVLLSWINYWFGEKMVSMKNMTKHYKQEYKQEFSSVVKENREIGPFVVILC